MIDLSLHDIPLVLFFVFTLSVLSFYVHIIAEKIVLLCFYVRNFVLIVFR